MKNAKNIHVEEKTADKIASLEELVRIVSSLRGKKKTIVHCHGVFDLLHVGHIRHFQQAKKRGDVLVVTVTPDKYVNKGPMRPAFTENLRAEAIAALDCVDYVAINNWPTAVETIYMLQPDFYAKGNDYRDNGKDITGGIQLEEEAIRSVGGTLIFTDDITFSSSHLINRYLPVLPQESRNFISHFVSRYGMDDIQRYFESARALKILVVGEAIIDEYHYCEAIGKSQKEPMLAVKSLNTERFAGGVLAIGNHLAGFCGQAGLLTFLGTVNPHEDFIKEKLHPDIRATFLYRENSPTIVKRRFVENYFFSKLFSVYEMNDEPLEEEKNKELCALLESEIPAYDVVVVVDYGHGMLTPEAIKLLCAKANFLVLNAQSNAGNLGFHTISRYTRADYICVAENEMRLEARDRRGDLKKMALDVSEKLSCEQIIVTRGKYGCLCYRRGEDFVQVPALANQVVDRMGAGDAFLSLTSLLAPQKAPMEMLGFVGNAVGAQAVATVGHRQPIERASLFKHMECLLK